MPATVAALNALALIASRIPKPNAPSSLYALVMSDTFIPLTIPTSWREIQPRYETAVSDYPVESGSFALYNKVRRPIGLHVHMTKTGSDVARFAWLAAIQQMESEKPTQLYTLITPQAVYVDYAITGLTYETRQDHGSNVLHLTFQLTQVPQIPSSSGNYDQTKEAKSGPIQQLGQVFTYASSAVQNFKINAKKFITG